jgi:hypothetical protein
LRVRQAGQRCAPPSHLLGDRARYHSLHTALLLTLMSHHGTGGISGGHFPGLNQSLPFGNSIQNLARSNTIEDRLEVPTGVGPGEYVIQVRFYYTSRYMYSCTIVYVSLRALFLEFGISGGGTVRARHKVRTTTWPRPPSLCITARAAPIYDAAHAHAVSIFAWTRALCCGGRTLAQTEGERAVISVAAVWTSCSDVTIE